MPELNRENITKLIGVLNDVPDRQCDMMFWIVRPPNSPELPPPEERGGHCGTTACLAGWAVATLAPSHTLVQAHIVSPSGYPNASYAHVLLPEEWAQAGGLQPKCPAHLLNKELEFPPGMNLYAVQDIASYLLGFDYTLSMNVFTYSRGPRYHGISDRQWMIATLESLLATGTPLSDEDDDDDEDEEDNLNGDDGDDGDDDDEDEDDDDEDDDDEDEEEDDTDE